MELVYPRSEVLTIPPECYLQTAQKLVHTQQQRGRARKENVFDSRPNNYCNSRIGTSSERRGAFKHNYTVSQVGGHYEIVFYYKRCFLCMQNEPAKETQLSCGCPHYDVADLLITLAATRRCSESR